MESVEKNKKEKEWLIVAGSATLTSGTSYVYSDSADITSGARKRICEDKS